MAYNLIRPTREAGSNYGPLGECSIRFTMEASVDGVKYKLLNPNRHKWLQVTGVLYLIIGVSQSTTNTEPRHMYV